MVFKESKKLKGDKEFTKAVRNWAHHFQKEPNINN